MNAGLEVRVLEGREPPQDGPTFQSTTHCCGMLCLLSPTPTGPMVNRTSEHALESSQLVRVARLQSTLNSCLVGAALPPRLSMFVAALPPLPIALTIGPLGKDAPPRASPPPTPEPNRETMPEGTVRRTHPAFVSLNGGQGWVVSVRPHCIALFRGALMYELSLGELKHWLTTWPSLSHRTCGARIACGVVNPIASPDHCSRFA